jgi:hypothetical protein
MTARLLEAGSRTRPSKEISHSYGDNNSLSMTPGETSLDPRIIRTEEDCAANVRKGKPHYHRVYDPGAPRSEHELVLRLAACTRVDCPNRLSKPGIVHYHQGPKQDSDMENVAFINLDLKR